MQTRHKMIVDTVEKCKIMFEQLAKVMQENSQRNTDYAWQTLLTQVVALSNKSHQLNI